jgi:hypothetical protein
MLKMQIKVLQFQEADMGILCYYDRLRMLLMTETYSITSLVFSTQIARNSILYHTNEISTFEDNDVIEEYLIKKYPDNTLLYVQDIFRLQTIVNRLHKMVNEFLTKPPLP